MALLKRRKLKEGGTIPYAEIGEISGSLFDSLTPTSQYGVKSTGNAVGVGALKGAGSGAALGTMIMPGVGTAIGAGVGAIAGGITAKVKNDKLQKAENQAKSIDELIQMQANQAKLRNSDLTGSNTNQIYAKYGGELPDKVGGTGDTYTKGVYTAEVKRPEGVRYYQGNSQSENVAKSKAMFKSRNTPADSIPNPYIKKPIVKMAMGGDLVPLSQENQAVEGNSHEQGGVNIGGGVELEGGETVNKDFVFSEELGFAQRHKPIAKAIGKMEKKVSNNVTKNTIQLLKDREEGLKVEQESLKEALGLTPTSEYAYGGYIDESYLNDDPSKKKVAPVDEKGPYVPLDSTKTFRTVGEHNKYYNQVALEKLKTDQELQSKQYNDGNYKATPDDATEYKNLNVNDSIILGGGLPKFIPPPPQRIVYTAPPGKYKKLTVRPDVIRQGYNRNGKMGFKTIR